MSAVRTPIKRAALKKLKKELPTQYRAEALRRLKKLHRRTVTAPYVSQVLSGAEFDKQVLEVLVMIRDEHLKELDALTARVLGKR